MLATVPGGTAPQPTPPTTNPDAPREHDDDRRTAAPERRGDERVRRRPRAGNDRDHGVVHIVHVIHIDHDDGRRDIDGSDASADDDRRTESDDGGGPNWALLAVIVLGAGVGLFAVRRQSHSFRRKTK